MSPCDYNLFAKVKEPLRGTRYNTRDELIHTIGRSIRNITNMDALMVYDAFQTFGKRYEDISLLRGNIFNNSCYTAMRKIERRTAASSSGKIIRRCERMAGRAGGLTTRVGCSPQPQSAPWHSHRTVRTSVQCVVRNLHFSNRSKTNYSEEDCGREGDNAGEMSPGSNTESYPAFAHIGLRENPGKNLNEVTCPDRESNPGHLVSRLDALTVTPQLKSHSDDPRKLFSESCKKTKRRKTEHLREAANPAALALATQINLKASGKKKQLN
ncbi:hypothetical protein ANN_18999 [Periplaneta americana]|uniref:Uncharacterized protein n=1 Tax=Periplaneta americana TaxID=6978 RepID=A0ABQ8SRQ2_PERAM|nr:hypothetical protein ANN_18999 [Periplaneta americana]